MRRGAQLSLVYGVQVCLFGYCGGNNLLCCVAAAQGSRPNLLNSMFMAGTVEEHIVWFGFDVGRELANIMRCCGLGG